MNLNSFTRLSAFSLFIGLALIAQRASSLPFWDAATEYPTPVGSNYMNLSGLTNVEGNVWGACVTNNPVVNPMPFDVEVVSYALGYPGLECSSNLSVVLGYFSGWVSPYGATERIAINPPMLAGPIYNFTQPVSAGGFVITNAYQMTSDTIYYSFIFSVADLGQDTTAGSFICGFNNLIGPQTVNPTVVSARTYIKVNGSGYQLGIGANAANTAATYLPTVLTVGSTNFLVVSYTFSPSGGTSNYAQMWLNPGPSTFGAATPPSSDGLSTNNAAGFSNDQVLSFEWRQGNNLVPTVYAADLRIGYCWGCVTPPVGNPAPQAATLAIAAASTNLAVVSVPTNAPCYLLQSSTNLPYTSNTWPLVSTAPTVIGANYVVTNTTSVSVVTSNVVGNVTNFITNTVYPPKYFNAKTYAN